MFEERVGGVIRPERRSHRPDRGVGRLAVVARERDHLVADVGVVLVLHPAAVERMRVAIAERVAVVDVDAEGFDFPRLDELAHRLDQPLPFIFFFVTTAGREQNHRRAPMAGHDQAEFSAEPVGVPAVIFASHVMVMTILCIATYFKGEPFLRECKALGCTVLLLPTDKLIAAEWPRESIDEIHSVPREATDETIRRHVDKIARRHRIDRIAALDDFDVEMAAMLREHLRVPGLGRTTAARFRDKLAMRMQARTLGVPVPEFTAVFNDQDVADWAARVRPPWVLKPRSSAAAIGIRKVDDREALWRALDAAGDDRAQCVLEQFVPGDVYHVDSIVWRGAVLFAVAFKYGRPPMEISHQGGLFITRRLPDASAEGAAVLGLNRTLQEGLGLRRGVSHTEFIRGSRGSGGSGDFVFLETSARVGG